VDQRQARAASLSATLREIEDASVWAASAAFGTAAEVERAAVELGDDLLVYRARLCQVNMLMRNGDLGGAARRIWPIHDWAVEHGATMLRARIHLVWANIHRLLGDAAQCLEHSVRSVELLDEHATTHMQIWHRAKLADALGLSGSMEDARPRYAQAEELCRAYDQPRLLLGMLNNYAYTEYLYGDHARAQEVTAKLRAVAAEYDLELDPSALDTIAAIEIENGRYAEAEQTLLKGIDEHGDGRHEDADALAEYLLTLARARRGLGAADRAQASLDASRALCVERRLNDVLVRVHQEQAELHASRGEFAEAFAAHKEFFAAYQSLQSVQREAQARTRQAMFETAEARQEAERFREQARRDPLTGLPNRRYVDEHLPALAEADPRLTVALVDLDHFKQINDLLSHDVGDQVLIQVAKILETELAAVVPDGFAARLGGEEFVLVLPDTPTARAAAALEEIRRAVAAYGWDSLVSGLTVTVSIGVAGRSDDAGASQADLLSTADRNLYTAKRAGRDRVVASDGRGGRMRSYRDSAPAA
jgi:diguanylate cyclase (GGDEF)-like protein